MVAVWFWYLLGGLPGPPHRRLQKRGGRQSKQGVEVLSAEWLGRFISLLFCGSDMVFLRMSHMAHPETRRDFASKAANYFGKLRGTIKPQYVG